MSAQEHVLELYASIAAASALMLEAAKESNWDRLVELEQNCRALIGKLKLTDGCAGAGANFVERKVAFIRKVLADDAEIRRYTEPWMNELTAYLGSARQQHRLQRAYGTDREV